MFKMKNHETTDRPSKNDFDSTKSKKRKRNSENEESVHDTSKPTALFQPSGGRKHTLSIALPGNIIAKYASRLFNGSFIAINIVTYCIGIST